METENVQDQHPSEELTDEQSDAEFEARLRGDEVVSGASGDEDSQSEEEKADREGDEETAQAPEEDNAEQLKKERDALKKELSRVRDGKRVEKEEVERLKAELDEVKAKISKSESQKNPIDEWSLEQTYDQLSLWEEKAEEYRDAGESEKYAEARNNIRIIRKSIPGKIQETGSKDVSAKEVEKQIETSVGEMTTLILEALPDAEEAGSEVNRLGNEEMNDPKYHYLTQSVGPTIASQLATLRLILKNPDLLKGKEKPEKVLKAVNKQLTKASMTPGAKNAAPSRVNIENLSDEKQDELFDNLIRGTVSSIG